MGARNNPEDDFSKLTDQLRSQIQTDWEKQGKVWELNPPQASHFGGVWERAIGQVRNILRGYLLPKQDRVLQREEFHTLLLHAARIVNSTPLHDAPE